MDRTDEIAGQRDIAGVLVPHTKLIGDAVEYARAHYEPYLFNHVMRSWLFAVRIAQIKGISHDGEVLAVGTLLHDVTLNDDFTGPRRFEVEAADIVRDYVLRQGMEMHRAQLIWDSVALNATPSIGLYKEAEVALCTAGIGLDVVGYQYDVIPTAEIDAIVKLFPRLDLKRKMTRCFCRMAETAPATSYGNFLQDFGLRYVPSYRAPSVTDLLLQAPFDD